jgi:hypothetical protein
MDEVILALRTYVGSVKQTPIEIDVVHEIPLVRTGKRSPVISELKYDFQDIAPESLLMD